MEVTLKITDHYPTVARVEGMLLNLLEDKIQITRINISGGKHLAHPDLYAILDVCKCFTSNVWVYTNTSTQLLYNTTILDDVVQEGL